MEQEELGFVICASSINQRDLGTLIIHVVLVYADE